MMWPWQVKQALTVTAGAASYEESCHRLAAELKEARTEIDRLRARNAELEAALRNVAEWYAVNGGRGAVHTDVFPIAAVRAAPWVSLGRAR